MDMAESKPKIIWTKIDEAPALATYSLFPIVKSFLKYADTDLEQKDISLAGRIIATFPEYLREDQRIPDYLAELGELVNKPEAIIIKLPNISASVPQLKAAIKELQEKGYNLPDYPEEPKNEAEKKIQERYSKVLGSAVNPVLRQGNSDRRAPLAVKEYAKKHPKSMGLPLLEWSKDSKCEVAHMDGNDFYGNEKSTTMAKAQNVKIEFVDKNGKVTVLKEKLPLLEGEVIDGTFMSVKALTKFYEEQAKDAKEKDVLLSLHLKATMMKVSDPVMFGHCVRVYYKDVFEKYSKEFEEIGVNPNFGISDVYAKIQKLPEDKRKEIEDAIKKVYEKNAKLAMVDSSKGITNLHVPNDIIVDASMPVVIRDGGKMWGADDKLHDTKAMIPDRCYATIYKEVVLDCQKNGAFDRSTMGSVSNVGLMAQKAEEYGSHDKTFLAPDEGVIRIVDEKGNTIMEHNVEKGDIWRACQAKDVAIKDWVKLAVNRAKASGEPAIFWLDKNRAHDSELIKKVEIYLKEFDTTGLDIRIMAPVDAMRFSLERIRKGLNTISVTGNVLRDYLTDLFPILELGTSAKMLSIVPLLNGGGLFETGAGGSAPKHVQQFLKEGHLRWDSLGEFSALWAALEFIFMKNKSRKVKVFCDALDKAIAKLLENGKSPSRKAGEIDNRGSHFYLALYWAEAIAAQDEDKELKEKFSKVAEDLSNNEDKIIKEILATEGKPVDIGGYYLPDDKKAELAMRPSSIFNKIIDSL
jgi:isocitrate dehydrogenase